ncbi:helix-turn-helix transcriptional regulator [Rhizobium ruizarguesonis]
MSVVNKKWFVDLIRDRRTSQAALARLLNTDKSTLSLLLDGKRRMTVERAADIARALNVPVTDVMRNAGAENIKPDGHVAGAASLPLVGWADGDGRVTLDWSRPEQRQRVDVNGAFPQTARAIQWRSAQTKAEVFDGWVAVVLPPSDPDPEAMIDRFCLVGLKGTDDAFVRKVRRGYTPGRYTLINHFGEPTHDAELAWYSPILTMMPV